MKYIDEFRKRDLVSDLAGRIKESASGEYTFMEVCGGHTAAIHRFGIPFLLPSNIHLLSGPGCPVCVTGTGFIDKAIRLSWQRNTIIATFGDMMRIPGSASSLEKEKSKGADIRIVFSGLDALEIAKSEPGRKVIFPGIGFETTAPGTAATIKEAAENNINNFYVLCAHKVMPPAMELIIREGTSINGFICPGHVSVITGSSAFDFIPEKYRIGCVVTGFEPVDILQAIYMLVIQVNNKKPVTEIQYRRAVTESGNPIAKELMNEVFEYCDENWRGLGVVPGGGMRLRKRFSGYDAGLLMPLQEEEPVDNKHCICGEILRGLKSPEDCRIFGKLCSPENPVGACMVSPEGTCNTFYKYRLDE
jgi:hydrogenase expression/formation protein HypD